MNWQILEEIAPSDFSPNGQTFSGTTEELLTFLASLQEKNGKCYSAQAINPPTT